MRDESEALSEGIDRLLDESHPQQEGEPRDPLLALAAALQQTLVPMPAPPEFRARLKAELLERYADNVRPFPVLPTPAVQPSAARSSAGMSRAYRAGLSMALASAAAVALLFGYNDLHDHGGSRPGGNVSLHQTDTATPQSTVPPTIAPPGTQPSGTGAQPGDNGVPGHLPTATLRPGSAPTTAQNVPPPAAGTGTGTGLPGNPGGHPLAAPTGTATPIPPATAPVGQPTQPGPAPSATAPDSQPTQALPTATAGGTNTATPDTPSTSTPSVVSTPQPTASDGTQVAIVDIKLSPSATALPQATATSRPVPATPVPPSATAIPPTATSAPRPSATAAPLSTATVPPTATKLSPVPPPSATQRPAATATQPATLPNAAHPTATPTLPRPTATAVRPPTPPTPRPTARPAATSTPRPTATATDIAAPRDTATAPPAQATDTPVAPATASPSLPTAPPAPSYTPVPSPTAARPVLADVPSVTGTPGSNSVAAVHGALTATPTTTPTLGTPVSVPSYPLPAPANAGPDSPLAGTKPLASGILLQVPGSSPSIPNEGLPILGGPVQQGESALATIASYGFSLQQTTDTVDGVSGTVTIDHLPYALSLKARSYGYQLALRLVAPAPKLPAVGNADPSRAARAFLAAHHLDTGLQPTGVSTDARKISTVGFATYTNTGQYQVAGAGATLTYTAGGALTGCEVRIVDQSGSPLAPAIGIKDALTAVANGAGLVQVSGGAVPTNGAVVSSATIVYVPVVASTGDTYYLPVYHLAGNTAAGASFDVYTLALRRGPAAP